MTRRRILIFGFSNVATTNGFSVPLIERMQNSHPDVDMVRIGLGAHQPHVVPAYLRVANVLHGPFTDVLLEIHASAFSLSRLSTPEVATELLRDTIHTAAELGMRPSFMFHFRNWAGKRALNFETLTHAFAAEYGIPVLDLGDGLAAELGEDRLISMLRDAAHTTDEGSALFAERGEAFLTKLLQDDPQPALDQVPLPTWRREPLELLELLPEATTAQVNAAGLPLSYALMTQEGSLTLDLGERLRVMALPFLYQPAGGRAELRCDGGDPVAMTSIDPVSYYTRIGAHAFDFYRGTDMQTIEIGPISDAEDVTLLRRPKTKPMVNFIGAPIVMRPTA